MPAYTAQQLAEIERAISKERLTRYLTATNNDFGLALGLYEQNVELCEGLFGFLHGLEVAVRNSIHDTLSAEMKASDWWKHGALLLNATAQPKSA